MSNPNNEGLKANSAEKDLILKQRCQEAVQSLEGVAEKLPSLIESELSKGINKWAHCFITQLSAVQADFEYLRESIPREAGDVRLCEEYTKELGDLLEKARQGITEEPDSETKDQMINDLQEVASGCSEVFKHAVILLEE